MKEILQPQDINVKQKVDHFVDQYLRSAFVTDEDIKRALTHLLNDAIASSKAVELRRIEQFIYERPESVADNKKVWELKNGIRA